MSVNKYLPHVFVLPEDDANRQLANGFYDDPLIATRRVQILPEAGGWQEVLNRFKVEHITDMDRYSTRFMVLLLDFDARDDRLKTAKAAIPSRLQDRVFILGVWTQPEELRVSLGSYETIGSAMARDCRENTDGTWTHPLLGHNAGELDRLRRHVRPILFEA